MLHLFLGGAALQRCGKCMILNPALAAEVAVYYPGMSFSATSLAIRRICPSVCFRAQTETGKLPARGSHTLFHRDEHDRCHRQVSSSCLDLEFSHHSTLKKIDRIRIRSRT